MTLTIVEMLLVVWTSVLVLATPMLVVYARRAAKAAAKVASYELTEDQLTQLERLVPKAVAYVDERVHKFLRGLVKEAPQNSRDKQALAVQVTRELAPDGLSKLDDRIIAIAVDAAVHDRRVTVPPLHLSFPPPSSFPPPAPLPTLSAPQPAQPAPPMPRRTP